MEFTKQDMAEIYDMTFDEEAKEEFSNLLVSVLEHNGPKGLVEFVKILLHEAYKHGSIIW